MVPFTVLEPRVAAELETLADTCRIELRALSRHPEQGYPSARDDIRFYTQQLKAFEKALANWLRGVRPVQTPSGAWLIPSASKPGEIHHCEKVDHLWICGPTCKASTFHWHGALMTAIESLAGQMTAIYHENDAYPDVEGYTPAPEVDDEPFLPTHYVEQPARVVVVEMSGAAFGQRLSRARSVYL